MISDGHVATTLAGLRPSILVRPALWQPAVPPSRSPHAAAPGSSAGGRAPDGCGLRADRLGPAGRWCLCGVRGMLRKYRSALRHPCSTAAAT